MTTTIYALHDIASSLGVTRPAVTNWKARYDDTPQADMVTTDGREFWSDMTPWFIWYATREARKHTNTQRRIAQLEAQLEALKAVSA